MGGGVWGSADLRSARKFIEEVDKRVSSLCDTLQEYRTMKRNGNDLLCGSGVLARLKGGRATYR